MTRQGITYKSVFEALGFEHISVDWNGEHGALPLDLREPLDLGTFGLISNIGTTEHVSEQEPVWRNIDAAGHRGSVFVSITPRPGDWPTHGEWYPTREFYRRWASGNGWVIERLEELYEPPVRCLGVRMTKVKEGEHWWPGDGYLYRNGG